MKGPSTTSPAISLVHPEWKSFLTTSTDPSPAQMTTISCLHDSNSFLTNHSAFLGQFCIQQSEALLKTEAKSHHSSAQTPLRAPSEFLPRPRQPCGPSTHHLSGLTCSSLLPCSAHHLDPFTAPCVCRYTPASGPLYKLSLFIYLLFLGSEMLFPPKSSLRITFSLASGLCSNIYPRGF